MKTSLSIRYHQLIDRWPVLATALLTLLLLTASAQKEDGGLGAIASQKQTTSHQVSQTWTDYSQSSSISWNDIAIVSQKDGWIVGSEGFENGKLYHWDGGQLTENENHGGPALYSIDMLSTGDGWAVGANGTIIYWDGMEWSSVPSPTSVDLTSVSMISPTEGWAVGGFVPRPINAGDELQVILRWDGTSWNIHKSGPGKKLNEVQMLSSHYGWIVGWDGTILHWNGSSWLPVPAPTNLHINDVDMVSPNDGWAVGGGGYGDNGFFLHWNGDSWSLVDSPRFEGLIEIDLLSAGYGWAAGYSGVLLQWNGNNWTEISSPVSGWIGAVSLLSEDEGWIAGYGGAVYRYGQVPPASCGRWERQGPEAEKDRRIETTLVFSDPELPCGAAFRLENRTDWVGGYGGYTLELSWRPEEAWTEWSGLIPHWRDDVVLLMPQLDAELSGVPTDPGSPANVFVRGDLTVTSASLDSAVYLLRIAMNLAGVGVACIDEEGLIFAAMETYQIIERSVELAINGQFPEAYLELSQVIDEFYERAAEVFVDTGSSCVAVALQELLNKPFTLIKIVAEEILWVGKVYYDYIRFQGQSANLTVAYSPSTLPELTETEVILIEPTSYIGEQRGSCWINSIAARRPGAWRCITEDNRIQDPCFSSPSFPNAVICHPSVDGSGGFKINLTEPLPTDSGYHCPDCAWKFELSNGAMCSVVATGTSPYESIDRFIWYSCDDGTQIEGSLQPGLLWTAKRVRISKDMSSVEELGTVTIRTVWQ